MYTLTTQPTSIQPSPTSSNIILFEDCWIDFLDHGLLARKLKGVGRWNGETTKTHKENP